MYLKSKHMNEQHDDEKFRNEAIMRLERLDNQKLIPREKVDTILQLYTQMIKDVDLNSQLITTNPSNEVLIQLRTNVFNLAIVCRQKMAEHIPNEVVQKVFGSDEQVKELYSMSQ